MECRRFLKNIYEVVVRYLSSVDARMRLGSSIIRLKKDDQELTPIYIDYIDGRYCLFSDCIRGNPGREHYNSEKLDISSPPLGYTSGGAEAFFVSRLPYRHQKQGVNHQNCSVFSPLSKSMTTGRHWPFSNLQLGKSIKGHFNNLSYITKGIRNGDLGSGALSRDLAVVTMRKNTLLLVYHKTKPIAYYLTQDKKFVFPDENLRECFKDDLEAFAEVD